MADILIIDDDPVICDLLMQMMTRIHHKSRFSLTGSHGLALAEHHHFDLVFLDVNLPDANGLELIKKLKRISSSPEIIIITGESEPGGAEMAIKSGAWNYLEKPFFRQEINLQVKRALQFRKEKGRVSGPGGLKRNHIIGESDCLCACLDQVRAAAYSDRPVLISGESGSGKDLFAKTIHLNSDRRENNFVIVDCAAMNETTADKLLYGSIEDIKDGKETGRPGFVALADNGTLLLDDISKLPLAAQQSLQKVMETHTFLPVGGNAPQKCRFQIIGTTRQSLEQMSDGGYSQNELLFSPRGIKIHLPGLRQMKQDIIAIAIFYMDRYCKKYKIESKGISPECLDILGAYGWPGNVRELINAVGKAISSAKNEPTVYSVHLPSHINATAIKRTDTHKDVFKEGFLPLKVFREQWEAYYLKHLFSYVERDVKKVSKIAGISKSSIYARLKRYNIN